MDFPFWAFSEVCVALVQHLWTSLAETGSFAYYPDFLCFLIIPIGRARGRTSPGRTDRGLWGF